MQVSVRNQVYSLLDVAPYPHNPDSHLGLLDSYHYFCSQLVLSYTFCVSKHTRTVGNDCQCNRETADLRWARFFVFLLIWLWCGLDVLWRSHGGRIREQWIHASNYHWSWRDGRCAQGPEGKLLTAPLLFPAFALQLAETFNGHDRLGVCYHVCEKVLFGIYVFGEALASFGLRIPFFSLFFLNRSN